MYIHTVTLRSMLEQGTPNVFPHQVSNHDGLSVPSQRVLQQSGELGVTVRDVGALPIHLGAGHEEGDAGSKILAA